jgi:hypothetical protein
VASDLRPRRRLLAGVHEATVTTWIWQHLDLASGVELGYTSDELDRAAGIKLNPESLEALCSVACPQDLREAQRVRLLMGTLRYGACGRNYYDAIGSCLARWLEYLQAGNREHLVDIANLVALEWLWPNAENPFWHLPVARERHYDPADLCALYLQCSNRAWLVELIDAVRREWACPSVPGAHWAPQDCGGHWSLRNR